MNNDVEIGTNVVRINGEFVILTDNDPEPPVPNIIRRRKINWQRLNKLGNVFNGCASVVMLGGLITGITTSQLMKKGKLKNPFEMNPYWWIGIDYFAGGYSGMIIGFLAQMCVNGIKLKLENKRLNKIRNQNTVTLTEILENKFNCDLDCALEEIDEISKEENSTSYLFMENNK